MNTQVTVELVKADGSVLWIFGPFTVYDGDETVTVKLEDVEVVEGGFLFPVVLSPASAERVFT